ncbi:M28 family peptidase [Granulicella sp. 5B5]|nr:M28 family peptidase [Granulicella sp. 5B5]
MRNLAAPLCLFAALASPLSAQQPANKDWNAAGDAWWSHVQILADDKLEGRGTGTSGYEAAAKYVEDQFKAIGLKPAGVNGYRQDVDLVPLMLDKENSVFQVGSTTFALGDDIVLSPRVATYGAIDAPMVFIGYGLHVPRKHVDDLAGLDLKGKIVVFYNAAPENLLGPQRAYARIAGERWKALEAAGALGYVQIAPPRRGAPPSPTTTPRPTLAFADPTLEPADGPKLVATLTASGQAKLFTGSGHTPAELKALADAGKPLPVFPLPGTLHAKTIVITPRKPFITSPNLIGELEGSDHKLRKEYVIISAHLDHLGVGKPVDGDSIYNGAMDNASGIASVIEAAKIITAGPRPKRSILFVAFMGEELGELGSQYFATKPTVPKKQIVGDLNMDMYLPLFPLRYLEVQGLGESTLGNDARAVCQLDDVEPQFDKQPDENRFVRSDQVNFVKQGIPALAFKFGWTPDSPEEKTFNDWVKTRYHRPSDDLKQTVDKAVAAQFTSLLSQLAVRVADAPLRPQWYPESSFYVELPKK